MHRILPLALFAVGCAELPQIQPCSPTVQLLQPTYLNLGNDDQMVASLRYTGCADYHFQLCGVGQDWFTEDVVSLGIAYDEAALSACTDEVERDQLFSLGPVRRRYQDQFDTDSAELLLAFGEIELDYGFSSPAD